MKKILIKNGTLVSTQKTFKADILINNFHIEKISESIEDTDAVVVDASGKLVLPGLIDPHTHMGIPVRGTRSADDFGSGTLAALYGGVTTIIDFTVQDKGESLAGSLKRRKAEAEGLASVDYALHCNITDFDEDRVSEIPEIVDAGVISFKIFMAYREAGMQLNDRQILEILWRVKMAKGTVLVHAENGDLIDFLTDKYVKFDRIAARYHPLSRPPEAEIEAVSRILALNKFIQCPLYFVHLTTAEAVQMAALSKQRKHPVYLETCPQYLIFNQSVYDREDGHRYIAAPPFRENGDVDFMWEALKNNWIDAIGTDHCPFTIEQKEKGDKQFHLTPNGLSGIETSFAVLYNEGVRKERLTIEQLVRLMSEEPARLFGLFPRKGILLEKSDADLVIFDPSGAGKISADKLHSNADWTPYEGMETAGSVESVMLRGKWLLKENKVVEENLKKGRFIPAMI